MSRKQTAKGRSKFDAAHVRLHHWMMQSEAWQTLSPEGRSVLVALYSLYTGTNNGSLFLSVREAAQRANCSKNKAAKGLRDLLDRGFIRSKEKGFLGAGVRMASTWILTEFPHANQLPTKEFMSWSAPLKTVSRAHSGTDCPMVGQKAA